MKNLQTNWASLLIAITFFSAGLVAISPPAHASSGPDITTQPSDQFSATGGTVEFSVVASGAGSLTFRWQKAKNADPQVESDWDNVSGGTSSSLEVVASTTTAGIYRVVVSDALGDTASSPAKLVVSPSPLFAASFSPDRIESGKQATSIINNQPGTSLTGVAVCFAWTIDGVRGDVFVGGGSWSSNTSTFTNTTSEVQEWKFEVWTRRDANGEPVYPAPSETPNQPSATCTAIATQYSPDIVASLLFVYPAGQLSGESNSVTGRVGTALNTGALTPNAGWPGSLLFSVSPDLPAGLTLNTETGAITGTPSAPFEPTDFVVSATSTVSGQLVWDASFTITLGVDASSTSPTSSSKVRPADIEDAPVPVLAATGVGTSVAGATFAGFLLLLGGAVLLLVRRRVANHNG